MPDSAEPLTVHRAYLEAEADLSGDRGSLDTVPTPFIKHITTCHNAGAKFQRRAPGSWGIACSDGRHGTYLEAGAADCTSFDALDEIYTAGLHM